MTSDCAFVVEDHHNVGSYPSPPPPSFDDDVTSRCEAITDPEEAASERIISGSHEMKQAHRSFQETLRSSMQRDPVPEPSQ